MRALWLRELETPLAGAAQYTPKHLAVQGKNAKVRGTI
jgi:hypothetical protein